MNIDYLNSIYGAGLGCLFAILIALFTYKYERYRTLKSAKTELLTALSFNHERVDQMFRQLAEGGIPNYNLDTTGMIIWINECSGIFKDKTLHDLNWHRYQMDHANTVLNTYYVTHRLGRYSERYIKDVDSQDRNQVIHALSRVQQGTPKLVEDIQKIGWLRLV